MTVIADYTRLQLDALPLVRGRPLVISDADEVIVHFAEPLEIYLMARGYEVDFKDYRLQGSVRRTTDGTILPLEDIINLVDAFFADEVENQRPVAGAIHALNRLGDRAQVVVLTNLPDDFRARRARAFAAHGLHAPVVANTGLKGASVRLLADMVQAPVIFIDDTEPHIRSVAKQVPASYRVHFVANERLARLQTPAPDSHHRSDCWDQTHDAVAGFLASHGY
ncbi:hypothetical protein [Govanella unica]|uniref:HAD family hydrolase n=1 Tax=Govanella unica TaxID=2975056 RepID=A0A9X3Z6D7_9PROT|nr:hypothetical protein [Govania unica]MDA5193110.1 hypothetical protein [Govania unica]